MKSGKFVLRIPPEMHADLQEEASQNNLSLNQIINSKLDKKYFDQFEVIKSLFKPNLLGIVLFGSYVRGETRKNSDIDLLIVLSDTISIQRSLYQLWDDKIEPKLGSKYSPQFSHLPKSQDSASSLWLEIAMEGEIIFDPSQNLRKSVYKIKDLISSGKYRRKMSYGHPYWIKQDIDNE